MAVQIEETHLDHRIQIADLVVLFLDLASEEVLAVVRLFLDLAQIIAAEESVDTRKCQSTFPNS